MGSPARVGEVAQAAVIIAPDTSCAHLDDMFRARVDLPSVVVAGDGGRAGLVMRDRFVVLMSGPFGYGRTLWARRQVAEVADWTPLRVDADTSLVAAANGLRSRPPDRRYDDVLVDADGGSLGRLSAAALLDGLASQFAYRATHDDLTGLVNRRHFLDLLAAACGAPGGDRLAVAVVDLDDMKRINDSYGHPAGDAVLLRVARHLSAAAAPGDVVARLGADEFVVLRRSRRHASAEQAGAEIGEQLRLAAGAPDGGGPAGLRVRASVGVAVCGPRADPVTLLSEADMAVFRAKQAGGDRVEVAVDVGTDLALDVDLVDRSVLDAIDAGELQVWYQPIVRVRDGELAHVEALVRWAHPRLGLLTPDRFLPGARRAGHLPALDRWVLTRACRDLAALRRDHGDRAPEAVAVNLSPATLATDFHDMARAALAGAGLPPARLLLELPEDVDLATLDSAAPRLERLRRDGIRLVLDDMGAGSTSLRHLSTVTISGLKIDAAFIAGMLRNPRDRTVVQLLADLGRGLGLPVTAEGIETADQYAALADLGIDYAQGFHLGRPQPFPHLVGPPAPIDASAGDRTLSTS